MSHKHKHAASKFEIALALFKPQIAFISGPHSGGVHDITVFWQGLKHRIFDGKLVIADGGYQSSRHDEKILSVPNNFDQKDLQNFKSCAHLRHETLNGRMFF
jgi:hypothetical protein